MLLSRIICRISGALGKLLPVISPSGRGRMLLIVANAALCLVFAVCMPANAASEPAGGAGEAPEVLTKLSLEELMEVTIITVSGASRYDQMSSEAPARVSVIDAETIRRYGYRTLADALQSETGINITDDRNYQYIGYRGLSRPGDYNSRILVMIDGVRLNDEVYHQAPIGRDFPLDMDLVERIEIIRGPSNALYGNNAFFLTVNVITVTAGANRVSAATALDTRSMAVGRVTGEVSPDDSDWGMLVSGSVFDGPGSKLYFSAYDDPATNNGISRNSDYEGGGNFFLKAKKGNLTLMGGYGERKKGVPTGAWDTNFNDPGTKTWDKRSFADLSYLSGDTLEDSIRLRSYYNGYFYNGRYVYTPADQTTYDLSRSVVLGGELVFTKKLPLNNHLVGGVDYHYALLSDQKAGLESTGEATLDLHSTQHSFGTFMQNEWRILPALLLDLGARYDYMSPSLHIFNPKAAVVYKISDKLVAKYLFGKSFRAPNRFERDYFDYSSNAIANPNLRQESMLSHELLLEYYHGPGQRLSLTFFDYSISNLITQTVDVAGMTQFQNVDSIKAKGIELEGDWRWDVWSGRVGYSYQQTKDLQSGQRLSNSPDSLLKLRVSREFLNRRLTISTEAQYVSSLDTLTDVKGGNYALLHFTAYFRDLFVKNLDASIAVKNLLNRQYGQPGAAEHVETSHPLSLIPQDDRTAIFKLEYRY